MMEVMRVQMIRASMMDDVEEWLSKDAAQAQKDSCMEIQLRGSAWEILQ